MKRAVFVTFGTIAGLTATLRYTPDNPLLTAGTDLALGGSQSLGTTQSMAPAVQNSPNVPAVSASKTASSTPTKSPQQIVPGTTTKPAATKTAKPKPTAKPHKTAKPKPTPKKTVKPKPTPTNTAQGVSFTGNGAAAGWYGTVQVRIQVLDGRMTSITPLSWPVGGTSSSISQYSIPILIQEALGAQSSNVSTISGASYTSAAFRATLASAMSQAGL